MSADSADQALRLSDNAVDLAFEDALRDAANHPVPPTPETQELYARVNQGEADVKADQDSVNQLKKQLGAATGAHQDSVQQQLDVAQAQLGLDQDELDDAKEDLARSGADPISRIQRQLKRHDDSEHATDAKPASAPTLASGHSSSRRQPADAIHPMALFPWKGRPVAASPRRNRQDRGGTQPGP